MKETKSKQPARCLQTVLDGIGRMYVSVICALSCVSSETHHRTTANIKSCAVRIVRSFAMVAEFRGQQLAPVPVTFIQAARQARPIHQSRCNDQLHFCSSNSGRLSLIEVCGKSDQ